MKSISLPYICELIFQSTRVPTYLLNDQSEIVYKSAPLMKNPLSDQSLNELAIFENELLFPYVKSTPIGENYLILKVEFDTSSLAIVIGPSIERNISEEMVVGMMNDLHISMNKKDELFQYFHSLLTISHSRLLHIGSLLYYLIFHQKLDISIIERQNSEVKQRENPDLLVSKTKQDLSFHYAYIYEKRLLQLIKDGKKDELLQVVNFIPQEGRLGTLSKKSMIRNEKNLIIAGITLATRAAIEGGLPSEEAYILSDLYIQALEEKNDINEIYLLSNEAILEFTERVSKLKDCLYSTPILSCQKYIQKHLYKEITLSELATIVKLNPSYVSQLFKREVGITVNEYILRSKIEEAQKLLTLTDTSISEIYSLLNFYDQSYFTKVFKKYSKMTPKKYREQYFITTVE